MHTPDLEYLKVVAGVFLERPNRFVAKVTLNGREEWVHVKNTGRCREILLPGTEIFLEESSNPRRKMRYSLIAAYKGDYLINIDSQAPNLAVKSALKKNKIIEIPDITLLHPEVTFARSRFDFYYEQSTAKGFIEVKGVTLERDGVALFPDAPTERGTRHLQELILATRKGYRCAVLFVVQLEGVSYFRPNWEMDEKFARAVQEAAQAGVRILAYECMVTPEKLALTNQIKVSTER